VVWTTRRHVLPVGAIDDYLGLRQRETEAGRNGGREETTLGSLRRGS
jgi:hypothetical protein